MAWRRVFVDIKKALRTGLEIVFVLRDIVEIPVQLVVIYSSYVTPLRTRSEVTLLLHPLQFLAPIEVILASELSPILPIDLALILARKLL